MANRSSAGQRAGASLVADAIALRAPRIGIDAIVTATSNEAGAGPVRRAVTPDRIRTYDGAAASAAGIKPSCVSSST